MLQLRPKASVHGLRAVLTNLEDEAYHRLTVRFAAMVAPSLGYAIAVTRADFHRLLNKPSRLMVQQDLESLLGNELGPEGTKRVVRDYFRHKSCKTMDTALISRDPQSFKRLVKVKGRENIDAALAKGGGAVLCTGHLNATICLAALTLFGLPVTGIARWSFRSHRRRGLIPHRVARQYEFVHLVRQNIETSGETENGPLSVAVEAVAVLRRNECVFIPIDVGVRDSRRAVSLPFLNGRAILLPGSVLISKLAGAPLLMVFLHRSSDWRHQWVDISDPIPVEGDTTEALQRCLDHLDAAIRREPAQWDFWGSTELRTEVGLLTEETMTKENV